MVRNCIRYGILVWATIAMAPGQVQADTQHMNLEAGGDTTIEAAAGYRDVRTQDNPNRAAEYMSLDSSPTFRLLFQQDVDDHAFSLEGDYLNENDYHIQGHIDYKTLLRLDLREERMFHNLDHIPYENHPEARRPASFTLMNAFNISDPNNPIPVPDVNATRADYKDHDAGKDYGRRVTIDEVKLRGKLPDYPAHVNLSYWRLEKKGDEQLRFVDENCAAACHMQSRTRQVDRVTEEFALGLDAHLGPVDVVLLQTLREFRTNEQQLDSFATHTLRYFGPPRNLEHDALPESRMTETTFMVNLPPSGGFVTAASYTFGKRENDSKVAGVQATDPETDYQKLAADVTYTPGEHWTFNFRYRMLDLDSDVPSVQTSNGVASAANPFFFSGIQVRESIDIDRNNYAATVTYRPFSALALKGEFEREDIERSDTGLGEHHTFDGVSNPSWALPGKETIDRFRLGFSSKMLQRSALKVNGWYEHRNIDDPAYGTTLESSDQAFLSATFKPSPIWGATGSIDVVRGKNDERTVTQFYDDDENSQTPAIHVPYDLDRREERETFALGTWYTPNEVFSADFNYGLLHSRIDQDVLFGSEPDPTDPGGTTDYTILDNDSDYSQRVQTLSAGVNLKVTDSLSCRVEGYHVRSKASFSPGFDPATYQYILGSLAGEAQANPSGMKEINELDIRQNGIKARLRWKMSSSLTAGLEYTYDDYEDRNASAFDGSVQTCLASLTGVF